MLKLELVIHHFTDGSINLLPTSTLPKEPVDVDEPLMSFPSDINKSPPEVNVATVVLLLVISRFQPANRHYFRNLVLDSHHLLKLFDFHLFLK